MQKHAFTLLDLCAALDELEEIRVSSNNEWYFLDAGSAFQRTKVPPQSQRIDCQQLHSHSSRSAVEGLAKT